MSSKQEMNLKAQKIALDPVSAQEVDSLSVRQLPADLRDNITD